MLKRTTIILVFMAALLAGCSEPTVVIGVYNVTQIFPGLTAPAIPTSLPPTPRAAYPAAGYPAPATPGALRPYPGQTVIPPQPTLDPAEAEATFQTAIAANTATTAALLQTATAEAAARPTSAAVATRPLVLEQTQIFVNSQPACVPAGQYRHCHDAVLAMGFDYPSAWGEIMPRLRNGADTGYAYDYDFSAGQPGLQAGGRSADFSEGRDMMLTDFLGFEPGPKAVSATCKQYGAAICWPVQPDVLLMIQFPVADQVCDPGGGTVFLPTGLVAINLAQRPNINGFIFTERILSAQLQADLGTSLGFTEQLNNSMCQDATHRQQFDNRVAGLIASIQAGTIDAGTQTNIDQLMHLAQSITFD